MKLFILFFLTLLSRSLAAQIPPGIKDSIYSESLKEMKKIQVVLPESYKKNPKEKYEVLYVVDGEWYMTHVPFTYNFAMYDRLLPDLIQVFIPNNYINQLNLRDRDFLPKIEGAEHSGGVDKFLNFIEKELMPFVNKKYPANGVNSILGSSLGGWFAIYTLLERPHLFESYLTCDPPLRLGEDYLNKLAIQKFKSASTLNKSLWIAGCETTYEFQGIKAFDSILKTQKPKDLTARVEIYPNETHYSVQYKGFYDGLRYLYHGFAGRNAGFHPMNGILLKDKPIKIWSSSDPSTVRYTLDGSEPQLTSQQMPYVMDLSSSGELRMKSFSIKGKYDAEQIGKFQVGNATKPVSLSKNSKPSFFNYSIYKIDGDDPGDLKKQKAVRSGVADKNFDPSKIFAEEKYAIVMEAYLELKESGYYIFILPQEKTNSRFYLADMLLINNDQSKKLDEGSFILPLEKGYYPIRQEFIYQPGRPIPVLMYLIPNQRRPEPVPISLLYSVK